LGAVGLLLMNHLYPPFNNVRARRAILMAMSAVIDLGGLPQPPAGLGAAPLL
jgi:ABC-type transport system substrate-binding protein